MAYDPGPKINLSDPRYTSRDDLSGELHSQLEELFGEVWSCEANWRFDDRLDMAQAASAAHRCHLPAVRPDDPWRRDWKCSACGQAWVKPPWYSAHQPGT